MAVYKQANKLKKLEQSAKKYEYNNPKMAKRIRNKILSLKGK